MSIIYLQSHMILFRYKQASLNWVFSVAHGISQTPSLCLLYA